MNKNNNTPISDAFNYTIMISLFYMAYKYSQMDTPTGTDFIPYIIPLILTEIVLVAFPLLLIFFYFKNGEMVNNIKDNIFEKNNPDIKEMNNQEKLRQYHVMLKEGIITQDEYDTIKKRFLKEIGKV